MKTGKAEITFLLKRVFEKYQTETGDDIIRDTQRFRYEGIAKKLSEISNDLPNTSAAKNHETYPKEAKGSYIISPGQIEYIVAGRGKNPKPYIIDTFYIYLYGVGRKGFKESPKDDKLIKLILQTETDEKHFIKKKHDRAQNVLLGGFMITGLLLVFTTFMWYKTKNGMDDIKKDMSILPYQPTKAEIDSLEGVWLCYTGSPQARSSDPGRFHLVVSNVVDVKYKNGYFTFNRYGASFDHLGYMQFEAPWLVSIHSYVKNNSDSIQSPRHSLMCLGKGKSLVNVISASWSFDTGKRNQVIGIREIYKKLGKGGTTNEIINTIENSSCKCKIIRWHQANNKTQTLYIRNEFLDTLADARLKDLLDEKSIILAEPQEKLLLTNKAPK